MTAFIKFSNLQPAPKWAAADRTKMRKGKKLFDAETNNFRLLKKKSICVV